MGGAGCCPRTGRRGRPTRTLVGPGSTSHRVTWRSRRAAGSGWHGMAGLSTTLRLMARRGRPPRDGRRRTGHPRQVGPASSPPIPASGHHRRTGSGKLRRRYVGAHPLRWPGYATATRRGVLEPWEWVTSQATIRSTATTKVGGSDGPSRKRACCQSGAIRPNEYAVAPDGSFWAGWSVFDGDRDTDLYPGISRFDGQTWMRYLPGMAAFRDGHRPGWFGVGGRKGVVRLRAAQGPEPEANLYVITPEAVAAE